MGYTTKFTGALQLSRALTLAEANQILEASEDPDTIQGEKPVRSYMQWVPTESLDQIVWDGGEKFYDYTAWMQWMCGLLASWGVSANGTVFWSGEDADDTGTIDVTHNAVTETRGKTVAEGSGKPLTMQALQAMALKQITSQNQSPR